MPDNLTVNCGDLRKKTKSFLEDLLSEEEYQAFASHIEKCSECKRYVLALDSISNQLYRLGEVKAPADFSSTVLFKLKQIAVEGEKVKPKPAAKLIVGIVSSLVLLCASLFIINYFKTQARVQKKEQITAPKVVEEPIAEAGSHQSSGVIAVKLNLPIPADEKETVSSSGETANKVISEESLSSAGLSEKDRGLSAEATAIHWHIRYSKESETVSLQNTLNGLDIMPAYNAKGLVVFDVRGDKLEQVFEGAAQIFKNTEALDDFTSRVPHERQKYYHASIYLLKDDDSSLHWHVAFSLPEQRARLLEIISEKNGSLNYQSKDLLVVSIPRAEIDNLKIKILAMGSKLVEYGKIQTQDGVLSSGGLEEVSIYIVHE